MIGTSQYYLGDFFSSRRHLGRVLAHVAPAQKWQTVRFQVDQWAGARAYLARVLWLQGLPDQAMWVAESSVAAARATNHAISMSDAHHTDGGGLSDHVFAIMYLLGIRFQPRMWSPNDRRLYAFEAKGRYGVLAPEFAERIAREATTEAEQQAARDARYAARKARKRKGR